jgi:hypothetical protein
VLVVHVGGRLAGMGRVTRPMYCATDDLEGDARRGIGIQRRTVDPSPMNGLLPMRSGGIVGLVAARRSVISRCSRVLICRAGR